jgi:hypothetical protein
MIGYCLTWVERIRRQEEIAERIGTKAFLRVGRRDAGRTMSSKTRHRRTLHE